MNDMEYLRDAMHTTPGFEPKPLDLTLVMHAGGRLRRRRQAAIGAVAGFAVLALLVGGAQLARPQSTPAGVTGQGQPVGAAPSVPPSDPATRLPDPGAPMGTVVNTGMKIANTDRVVWMRQVDEPSLPKIKIGMAAGRRTAAGELITDVVTNETEGSAQSPGFHALEMAMELGDGPSPAFGYWVGAAAKITVVADGRRVQARQARWSEDTSVVLFWFDLDDVGPDSKVGKATARDADGDLLPAGNAAFAVG